MSRYCEQCGKTQYLCICQQSMRQSHRIKIIILQHPDEVKRPLSTAIIAKQNLQFCDILVGEDFSLDPHLTQLLEHYKGKIGVLFPTEGSGLIDTMSSGAQQPLDAMIIIDGTWRKAYKMWQLTQTLHELPQYHLPESLKGNYRLRKAPSDNALSTVESIAALLAIAEDNQQASQQLHNVFDQMIERQMARIPDEVKARNYRN
ncbi:tRNA-uridine aminocarboxypropyltransferase [Vibrio ulleungensis]|uniref:tRNA-uridine aminocarboxypropyltransferase n=1 Tax=Vibrio ulleungensis TaxID=2807619 RepID=A0ABS2HKC0_9VIBR|nr:tRNA-uridine aminocarboxypropyltransferase [Vibrio ulleungensis]MBM7036638.1 DTW domain-containing protein [Vibrio ulleungensis]